MIVKHYAYNITGAYIGAFAPAPPYKRRIPQRPIIDPETGEEIPQDDLIEIVTPEVVPPENSVEVPHPPQDGRAIWDAEAGGWIEPAPILPDISARQLRLMLLDIGITPAMVDAELATIADETERTAAQIEWEYASTYQRTHPLIDQMAAAFELPAAQVDTLWAAAADL